MTLLTLDNIPALQDEVRALAAERGAVILAHNYQLPEVQEVADYVGDSLGLSQQAAKADADVIAFCGVHFMAETASILAPDKTVLLHDVQRGQGRRAHLRRARPGHPDPLRARHVPRRLRRARDRQADGGLDRR